MQNDDPAAALVDPAVDAVIVATDNASHHPLAMRSLEAGKHTLVEYPLCHTVQQAEQLLALAQERRRVMQTEVIGLLTEGFRQAQEWVAARRAMGVGIANVRCAFSGGSYRWVADEIRAGHYGQLALGRLHLVVALFPHVSAVSAQLTAHDPDSYALIATLQAGQTQVTLQEVRAPGRARRWSMELQAENGARFTMPTARRDEGLFAHDLDRFVRAIRYGEGVYVPAEQVIQATHLAERITALAASERRLG